jgi:hypothetical protein
MRILANAVLASLAFPAMSFAQIVSEHEALSDTREKLIIRSVWVTDSTGTNVLVEQILKPLPNGDLLYSRDIQPQATLDVERQLCESSGMSVFPGGMEIWGPETLSGGSCHRDLSDRTDVRDLLKNAPSGNEGVGDSTQGYTSEGPPYADLASVAAPYIQVRAPHDYVVPVGQNSLYQGLSVYQKPSGGYVTSEIVVDKCLREIRGSRPCSDFPAR